MSLRRSSFFFIAVLCALPIMASAQAVMITPELVDSSAPVTEALKNNPGHATTTIDGEGGSIVISYSASVPVQVYMVPLRHDGSYALTNFVRFILPAGAEAQAHVDLTVSPGWRPGYSRYLLNLLAPTEDADVAFTGLTFETASAGTIARAGLRHFFTPEPYTPSSYHALWGYRVLGAHLSTVTGILALVAAVTLFIAFGKKPWALPGALAILVGLTLFYQARVALDLLRFSAQHLSEYRAGTYDEAGSVHAIARFINQQDLSAESIYICRDGTNFKQKLLRYFVYPATVSDRKETAGSADLVLVMDKFAWSYENGMLTCENVSVKADLLKEFPAGEQLFEIRS